MLEKLLSPSSIVVIGGSDDTSKPGGLVTKNILSQGYAGELFVVNPRRSLVQGIQAYPSITDLPVIPDLALIAVPAPLVRGALQDLAHKGTRVVIILSAGFGELGEEGRIEEGRLADIASKHDMLLLGPNCLGAMTHTHASKFAGILPQMKEGGIDFISGSGATIDYLAEQALRRGLSFGSFLTVGNSAHTGVTDLLSLFDQRDPASQSRIKLLYLESLRKPQLFLEGARGLVKKGFLLAGIKSGTTEDGSRAAASHTGAMATSDSAVQALFEKAGVIRVPSRLELVDVACAFECAQGKLDGKRVCVVSDAGGPGVMLADELNRQGFEVPVLGEKTQALLKEVLPPGASVVNPVDCMPTRSGQMIGRAFAILAENEADRIDYIMFMIGDSRLSDNEEIFQAVAHFSETGAIPIFPSFCSAISSREGLAKFRQRGRCYFEDEVSMARALSRVVNRPTLSEPEKAPAGYDRDAIQGLLGSQTGIISAQTTRQILKAAGLRFPHQEEIHTKDQLKSVRIPFPWVMKVLGPLHKTDLGGVRLDIPDLNTALQIWDELLRIQDAAGCLVQEQVDGQEILIGAKREDGFGHLIGFGLGGIYAEALQDIHFVLAPLSTQEAQGLVRSIRSLPILEGTRGLPGVQLRALEDWLLRISQLVTDFPHIQELDINPVKGLGDTLYAVDTRIILDP